MLREINRMFHEYFARTGVRPTRIYVGRGQYRMLRMDRNIYITGKCVAGDDQLIPEVMGMRIYEVDSENHLYVC